MDQNPYQSPEVSDTPRARPRIPLVMRLVAYSLGLGLTAVAYWYGGVLGMVLVALLFFVSAPIVAAYDRWRKRG